MSSKLNPNQKTIKLGISTCPNDTFAFYGLMNRKVDWRGLDFQVELMDVQQLNYRLSKGDFDIAKASFHAAIMLAQETWVLPSGSALGFGNGPLLLSRYKDLSPEQFRPESAAVVLCPGETTTATLLYRLFHPGRCELRHVVFSEIMPALQRSDADFGVCIHEGRFTWDKQGLYCVEDLGKRWHDVTSQPLPLGGILARRTLDESVVQKIQDVIHDSLQYGLANREATLPGMRAWAAEMDDDVLMSHVDLYVNDYTISLGRVGQESLNCLSRMARQVGIPGAEHSLEIFGEPA